jgi:Tol biopolymer transport system component
VSPDGRRIVFVTTLDGIRPAIVVCDLADCSNRRELELPKNLGSVLYFMTRGTPDGREIAYTDVGGASVWAMPLDGGEPHPITNFAPGAVGDAITSVAWSHDGQRLAIGRVAISNDIVLLTGLRP